MVANMRVKMLATLIFVPRSYRKFTLTFVPFALSKAFNCLICATTLTVLADTYSSQPKDEAAESTQQTGGAQPFCAIHCDI